MEINQAIEIGTETVNPGERRIIMLPMPQLYDCSPMYMPVNVICGRYAGPVLAITAAIHGDEINGVEIVRRLLERKSLKAIHGTLIAIPIVNVYGFIFQSRYLMDRRDLNRSFPGSNRGSLGARLANFLLTNVLNKATHVIDLHTGSLHRTNVPQVRASLDKNINKELASVFGAPVILDSRERDGSLRQAMNDLNVPFILYEAGEALRFDEISIHTGLRGIMHIMQHLQMIPVTHTKQKCISPSFSYKSSWIRASASGIMVPSVHLGDLVKKGEKLGIIANPLASDERSIISTHTGIIIGKTNLPLIHQGEALFHIAVMSEPAKAEAAISKLEKK